MITKDPPPSQSVKTQPVKTPRFMRPKWCSPWVWQVFILIAGVATILVGVVLLPAPGPGSLVIYAGLGILATEFVWAKRWFILIGRWAKRLFIRFRIWVKQMWRRKKP